MWVRMPTWRDRYGWSRYPQAQGRQRSGSEIVVEDSHDVLTIVGVSTSVSARTTVIIKNGSIEVVVVEERTFVVETQGSFCFPPLAGIPVTEGEVGLLVAECVQGYVVLVTNGTGVTLIAILV